ncbi:hypothetical protein AHF37_08897 [Paragonimus kellicotti]|nr:hypothetical protein AHF37_08897 [Paragonimus kellicotti]
MRHASEGDVPRLSLFDLDKGDLLQCLCLKNTLQPLTKSADHLVRLITLLQYNFSSLRFHSKSSENTYRYAASGHIQHDGLARSCSFSRAC